MIWLLALLVAFAVRVAPIAAGKPYIAYVDEGNFLHPVVRILRDGGWDPRSYDYPQFPRIAVAAAMRTYAQFYLVIHGQPLKWAYSPEPEVYDVLEPFDLLVIARIMSMLASIGIVVLTGVLAHRRGGAYAGAAAVSLAAVTPALAVRGAFAMVDPYAALFVVACLITTDASRTLPRPGLLSFLAGFFSGCAFASKYPAAIVIVGFGITTVLQLIPWRERVRRCALAAAGLLAGSACAMPAIIAHPGDVYNAIHGQAVAYSASQSPNLWQQAVKRAEWDVPYSGSELGAVYLGLAVVGFGLALFDRRWAPTVWGWLAFIATSLVLYGCQRFQPFRNLLPMVPLACVAVAFLYVRVRQHFARPVWADSVGVVALLVFLAAPVVSYAWERMHVVDSRTEVIDWLVANTGPQDKLLVLRELGFVNSELARLPSPATVQWWRDAQQAIAESPPRYVIAGILMQDATAPIDIAAESSIEAEYVLRSRIGTEPTLPSPLWWRGNREIIYIFERKPRGENRT